MRQILLLLTFFVSYPFLFAQLSETTKLRKQLSSTHSYEEQSHILFELSKIYIRNHPDSSYIYAKQLEKLAKLHNDTTSLRRAELRIGYYLSKAGRPQEALSVAEKNISLLQRDSSKRWLLGSFYQLRGNCEMFLNKKENALSDFYTSLQLFEKIDSLNDIAGSFVSISWVYMELFQFEKAITELQKTNAIYQTDPGKISSHTVTVMYNNLASCYGAIGKIDSAYFYLNKGIHLALQEEDYQNAANGMNIWGMGLLEEKKYNEALEKLQKAKELREKVGDPFFIVSDMAVLARAYGEIGKINEGIKISEEALAYAEKNKLDSKLPLIYGNLAFIYEKAKNYKEALRAYKKLSVVKDSLYEKANAEELAKLQVQYETEKKEAENKLLEEENNLNEAKISNKNHTISILVVSIFLTVALMFVWVNRIRLRKKESELKAIQQIQKDKERIARDLHDNVGGQLSYILYSLDGINEETKEKRIEITESINQTVRSVIGSLRETIWAISDANIQLQDFSDRLKVYTRDLYKHTNTVITYKESILSKRELNALLGLNLYRICQEILTNAFKHAKAEEVVIELKTVSEKLIITISDNGTGFDMSCKNKDCYGLQNTRKRAAEFGISLLLHSEIGKGCRYEIIV